MSKREREHRRFTVGYFFSVPRWKIELPCTHFGAYSDTRVNGNEDTLRERTRSKRYFIIRRASTAGVLGYFVKIFFHPASRIEESVRFECDSLGATLFLSPSLSLYFFLRFVHARACLFSSFLFLSSFFFFFFFFLLILFFFFFL